jgi:hypothetical protein
MTKSLVSSSLESFSSVSGGVSSDCCWIIWDQREIYYENMWKQHENLSIIGVWAALSLSTLIILEYLSYETWGMAKEKFWVVRMRKHAVWTCFKGGIRSIIITSDGDPRCPYRMYYTSWTIWRSKHLAPLTPSSLAECSTPRVTLDIFELVHSVVKGQRSGVPQGTQRSRSSISIGNSTSGSWAWNK